MTFPNLTRAAGALGIVAVLLTGCGRSRPTNFYLLSSLGQAPRGHESDGLEGTKAVGIGPVAFPEYLNRPQIVTRSSGHRLLLAEFDRWAEPLGQRFSRVLVENLSALLHTERITVLEWKNARRVDYRVTIEVLHFERRPDGHVALDARWAVLDAEGAEITPVRLSRITASAEEMNYEALAAAMSATVESLSREIASAISAGP